MRTEYRVRIMVASLEDALEVGNPWPQQVGGRMGVDRSINPIRHEDLSQSAESGG
jgi:hypothetical protein